MDGVRRERHPQLSFVSADLPDWLPWRRTDQTHRLPLGEQQDMTFLFFLSFFLKIPLHFLFHLTFVPGWLERFFFSNPTVVLMRLHDDWKELCWSNHRLLVSKTVRALQLCSGFLLTSWGETGFCFFVSFGNRQELVKLIWIEDMSWNGPTCSLSDSFHVPVLSCLTAPVCLTLIYP